MGQQWTEQQSAAIRLRDRSILVSAAAGSGKTAVLVERIVSRITDEKNPINLDELLVVTFTRAAAAQMRERIRRVLLAKIEEQPDNLRLREQLGLVPYAQISTIDSFCRNVVMDHFQMVDSLDPGFRIADEGEARLMREDALDAVIEKAYESEAEGFLALSEVFSTTKGDGKIRSMVLGLYQYSSSAPWPEEWLEACRRGFRIHDEDELKKTRWCQYAKEDLLQRLQGITDGYGRMLSLCNEAKVPEGYLPAFQKDYEALKEIAGLCDAQIWEIAAKLQTLEWQTKPRKKKSDDVSADDDFRITGLRRKLQEQVKQLKKQYRGMTSSRELLGELEIIRPYGEALIDLTDEFIQAYSEIKRKKNVVDFHDIEHFALKILVKEHDREGGFVPSEAALAMQKQFKEVMVDEYQDSNMVQEYILLAVSGELTGHPNLFMVGDVKQSIYRFRLARPQLFMEKYDSFSLEESSHQKIELQKNFRSRKPVLDSINHVFYEIMDRSLGQIDYTRENALYAGRVFEEAPEGICTAQQTVTETMSSTELLLLDLTEEETTLSPEEMTGAEENVAVAEPEQNGEEGECAGETDSEDATKIEWEARMVAERICQLMEPSGRLHIYDENRNHYRPLEYGDILILLRTVSGWSDTFVKVLEEYGIPAVCESKQGYFQAYEVKILLNCLRIIDNPHQDIPLMSVLYSPIGGFTSEELAQIRIAGYSMGETGQNQAADLYAALTAYDTHLYQEQGRSASAGEEKCGLAYKVHTFLKWIDECRRDSVILSIHDLLVKLLKQTEFELFVSAMPAGEMRKVNIDTLLNKTISFEKTSYSGLFQFIRYVEQLEKYEMDFAQQQQMSSAKGTNGKSVQIMSIHKSKGLEYPVVILAGCGKQFNREDFKQDYCLDEDLGMALSCIDGTLHVKYPSAMKTVFFQKKKAEAWGEELRILYVAMTRAKELLIMTAATGKLEERIKQISEATDVHTRGLSYLQKISAVSYLDWLLGVCVKQDGGNLCQDGKCPDGIQVKKYHTGDLMLGRVEAAERTLADVERLYEMETSKEQRTKEEEALYRQINHTYEFCYPYQQELSVRANVSVSDLKHQAIERLRGDEEETSEKIVFATELETQCPLVPDYLKEEKEKQHVMLRGALRGTAYHTVLEQIDFTDSRIEKGNIREMLAELNRKGFLSDEDMTLIRAEDIQTFLDGKLGKRMQKAAKMGRLVKEEQFILGLTREEREAFDRNQFVPEVIEYAHESEGKAFVMVQGIIDGYFEEDGELVLMDYKTDHVSREKGEEELTRRYRAQLQLYDIALRRITGKRVKEWWIYSFCLERDICVFAADSV